jgi:hypothetical protein
VGFIELLLLALGDSPEVIINTGGAGSVFPPPLIKSKSIPFKVTIPAGLPASGLALADQVKRPDRQRREADWICPLTRLHFFPLFERSLWKLLPFY